jgi:hypothetical protein
LADDFISANGVAYSRFHNGYKQTYDLQKAAGLIIWKLKNGNKIAARFDQYGLSNATLSGNIY